MIARLRTWWKKIIQHRVAIGVVAIVFVVVIALIIDGYWFDWTGFDGYNQVTTAHTISGPSAGTVVRTEVYQPGKALWDWLQLLIIPAVLVVGGFLLNYTTGRNERQANEQRAQTEREAAEKSAQTERDIALDNQREAALQAYIDSMSELLLDKKLRESKPEDEVRTIARVRTLTVLPRLDGRRKGSVLQFLHGSDLININASIIDLRGADLQRADLSGANLFLANLARANLSEADLNGVDLIESDLSDALLSKTDLSFANLSRAYLCRADLNHAYLTLADLDGADLREVKLIFASMSEANLSEANLSKAVLNGADLNYANLTGANLSEAILSATYLHLANQSDPNLFEANLTEAKVTDEQLAQAKSLKGATMPDGTKHA